MLVVFAGYSVESLLQRIMDCKPKIVDVGHKYSTTCDVVWIDAEDPLFLLYTSGSTENPKGVLHTTGGYMIYTTTTIKYAFDYKESYTTSALSEPIGIDYTNLKEGLTQSFAAGVAGYNTDES
uniref:acetate--CoA ligase n=1 Tax=Lactuca sativa TaxID=4236 RepID=A0A9R1WHG1_LACSA|nr:hypothetical protein LSAT_V11C200069670 [Lactuca sativa]